MPDLEPILNLLFGDQILKQGERQTERGEPVDLEFVE
jgi:hypothetical protein